MQLVETVGVWIKIYVGLIYIRNLIIALHLTIYAKLRFWGNQQIMTTDFRLDFKQNLL